VILEALGRCKVGQAALRGLRLLERHAVFGGQMLGAEKLALHRRAGVELEASPDDSTSSRCANRASASSKRRFPR